MQQRLMLRNPFIASECARGELAPAPIATWLHETYGQCHEDLIVEGLMRAAFLESRRPMSSMRYIELGGNHPIQTSSTYLFYRLYGARGVICEANPKLAQILQDKRPGDNVVNCAVSASQDATLNFYVAAAHELSSLNRSHLDGCKAGGYFGDLANVAEEIEVPNMHINDFLQAHAGDVLDYLSVDLEGMDYMVISAIDFTRFRPLIVQCECHERPADAFAALLRHKGYKLAALTNVNAIFVRTGT